MVRAPETMRRVVVVAERVGTGTWCTSLVATTPGLAFVGLFSELDAAQACIADAKADVCIVCGRVEAASIRCLREMRSTLSLGLLVPHGVPTRPDEYDWWLKAPCTRWDLRRAIAGQGKCDAGPVHLLSSSAGGNGR